MDLSGVALHGVRFEAGARAKARAAVVVAAVIVASRTCHSRTSTGGEILAIVAQPTVVAVHSHVAVFLSIPVARLVAHSGASIPLVHLLETVVSVPALVVVVVARVTPDLSSIAFRDPGVKVAASRARA
jgi:hypothetical protein